MTSPGHLVLFAALALYGSLIVEIILLQGFGRLRARRGTVIWHKIEVRSLLLLLLAPMFFVGSGHHKDSGLLWVGLIVVEYAVAVTFLHFRMGLSISGKKSGHIERRETHDEVIEE